MVNRSVPISIRYRVGCYVFLALWSMVLVIFSVFRILSTLNLQPGDTLRTKTPYYDPVLIELAFVGGITPFITVLILYIMLSKERHSMISRNWFEITMLSMLWALWLGGSAASVTNWNKLNYCIRNTQCNILATIIASAWLGWVSITGLLFPSLFLTIRAGSWDDHLFEKWVFRMPPEPPPKYVEQNPANISAAPSAWSHGNLDKYKRPTSRLSGSSSAVLPYVDWSDRGSSMSHASAL